jgi:hypothetical protein
VVVTARPRKLIESFRSDPEIVALIEAGKSIKISYNLRKKEIHTFSVSALKKLGTPEDFEAAVEKMQIVQAYLNRLEEMRDVLLGARTALQELYQTGSIHISQFSHIQKVRTSSQRDSWVDEVIHPISSKLDKISELLENIESKMWNLKHCHTLITSQLDAAKTAWYMKNPYKHLEGRVK